MNRLIKVPVWHGDGERVVITAAPTPVPGLVIHADMAGGQPNGLWCITHTGAGAMVARAGSPESALSLANALAEVADWTRPGSELAADPDLSLLILAVIAQHDGISGGTARAVSDAELHAVETGLVQ